MNKIVAAVLFIMAVSLDTPAASDFSLGLYGGINSPLIQDDARTGLGLGIKLRYAPVRLFGLAAFYEARSFGNPERKIFEGRALEQTTTSDGGKVTATGLQLLLGDAGGGAGLHSHIILGASYYRWMRENYITFEEPAYHFGFGFEIGLPSRISMEAQARFEFIPLGSESTRKNLLGFAGLNYHFGLL